MDSVRAETVTATQQSYVDWSAVFAGAIATLAVSFVLLTFGAAVGLSAVSPWTSSSTTITAVGFGSAFWIVIATVWSFALGGYIASRMRHRWNDAVKSEVDFRDNAHGMLSWALAITLGALVAAFAAAPRSTSRIDTSPAMSTAVDTITRTSRANVTPADDAMRGLVSRTLLANLGRDKLDAADQTFLNELVAARTGAQPAEAERRVSTAFTDWKRDTDRARKAGIVMAFLTAATLLLGGATAWWAASVGGRHRDEGTIWSGFSRYSAVSTTP